MSVDAIAMGIIVAVALWVVEVKPFTDRWWVAVIIMNASPGLISILKQVTK